MKGRLSVGVFAEGHELLEAARSVRALGPLRAEAYSPCPVHGIDEVLGIARSRLPFVTLAAGATGLGLALLFQYWTSASNWPINVGGKPFDSLPAFMPVAFEVLVLLAGLSTAAALLIRSRLGPGAKGAAVHPRVTDDRFVLVVALEDASVTEQQLATILRSHGAVECYSEYRP